MPQVQGQCTLPHLHSLLTYLGCVRSVVYWRLQAAPQSSLRITASQKLPDLPRKLVHFRLVDLGLWGMQSRGVEVDAGVFVQGVDVDGAPCVTERRARMLLDN